MKPKGSVESPHDAEGPHDVKFMHCCAIQVLLQGSPMPDLVSGTATSSCIPKIDVGEACKI